MKSLTTTAIVLSRTDFGEADRILTLITPDQGRLRLMAKGVRRIKSKLAGGIELFSVSDIVFIRGRGEIGTLVSARLIRHYGEIVRDVSRTMLGYDLIKMLARATEDEPESEYFELLDQMFAALNDAAVPTDLIRVWFQAQLLRLSGHTPNLTHTSDGKRLEADTSYDFSYDDSAFVARPDGNYQTDDIKFLRIIFSGNIPLVIAKVEGLPNRVERARQFVQMLSQQYIQLFK